MFSLIHDQIALLKGREIVSDWIKTQAFTDEYQGILFTM